MKPAASPDVDRKPFATLCQLRVLVSAFRRRMGWHLLFYFAGFLALFAIGFVLGGVVNRANVPTNSPLRFVLIAGIFGPMFVGLFAMVWWAERLSPKCPHCQHSIALGVASYHVIVTRRCPECAQPLFEDELPIPHEVGGAGTPPLLSRSELRTAQDHANQSMPRRRFLWLIPGILLLVAGSLMNQWVQGLLASRLSEVWLPFVPPALLVPGFVVVGCAVLIEVRMLQSAQVHRPCPHCSAPISAHGIASRTGNCETCGQPAVGDPVPGMQPPLPSPVEPQWTVAEFRALAKHRHDRLWIGCLIGGALASICVIPFVIWHSSQPNLPTWLDEGAASLIAVVGILPGQLGGVWLWLRYSTRGLRCAECQNELLNSYRLVVSSHRCYHCGCTLLQSEGAL